MKVVIGIIVVAIIVVLAFVLLGEKPDQSLEQAAVVDRSGSETVDETSEDAGATTPVNVPNAALSFEFVGFGPGKSHTGTFTEYNISDVRVNAEGIPVSGTVTFMVESTQTDTEILDGAEGHLCQERFFDCANHKEVTFSVTNVTMTGEGTYDVTGDLTMKGMTKAVSFPVTVVDGTATAAFRLNVAEFGFAAPGIVNEEVEIKFTGTL